MSLAFEPSLMIFHRSVARNRLNVPKHHGVVGIEGDHKVSAVALKCYQPFRAVDTRGQLNLPRVEAATSRSELLFRLTPRDASDGGDHNAGRDQRILTDHVRWHPDVIVRNQCQQQCCRCYHAEK